jgi:S-adenosylmethionine uptake transporter
MTPAQHLAERARVTRAIVLACAGYFFFSVGDSVAKILTARFHFSEIIFIAASLTLVLLSIYGGIKEGRKAFRTKKPGLMALRAVMSQIIGACNILALPHVRLTTFYTLIFTSPFLLALLSAVFLKEKIAPRRLAVILAGFSVVLCVFRPGSGLMNPWTAAVLLGAAVYAGQLIVMRRIGTGESRNFMLMSGACLSLLWTFPLLHSRFIMPELHEWELFATLTLVNIMGILSITHAFQTVPAATILAPYHYTQLVWGALLGWFIFHETPDTQVLMGATAIIALGLYLIYSERRHSRIPVAETAVEV